MIPRFFEPPARHYFLFGPRGTGKSTWLREAYEDAVWIDLLAPDVERQMVARPEGLREIVTGTPEARHVVVDEVQRAPGLLSVVHQLIEERSGRTFVLTGSSARKLRGSVFRSLRPSGPLDQPEEIAGAALEGLVAQHLRAWIAYSRAGAKLSFWRTRAGSEVDLVVYGADVFWAIEVKHAGHVRRKDLRSLLSFREDYPEAELRLVYRGARTLEIVGIRCVPCERFLRVCGPEAGCREGRWRPGAWPATAPGALLLAGRAPAPTLR